MAGVIGSQPGAVCNAAALSQSRSLAGASTRSSSSSSTFVKSLSFVSSKELRGDDLLPRSGKKTNPKVKSPGKGAAFQVSASATSTVSEWLTGFLGKIVSQQSDTQNSVIYTGVATIAKKRAEVTNLVQFDLIDAKADAEDRASEMGGKRIEIQLVSQDLDPKTDTPKVTRASYVENWVRDLDLVADDNTYPIKFTVPNDFGQPGACIIRNQHPNELYLKSLRLEAPDQTIVEFPSNAWVHNYKKYPKDRVFFTNEAYLPSATPPGLKALREQELEQLRGDGTGERQPWERIYDYDVYNDMGDPDTNTALDRPPLGGSKDLPYPRRIRTGRPMSKKDPKTESPPKKSLSLPYIPSDEYFLRTKNSTLMAGTIKGLLQSVLPTIKYRGSDSFKSIKEVQDLYVKGAPQGAQVDTSAPTPELDSKRGDLVYFSELFAAKGDNTSVIKFALPQVIASNKEAWRTDEEYGHQALAGQHPNVIQLLTAYPPTSALDPAEYGEGSALTDKHILPYLEGLTVAQAIQAKKLFIIDYHDAILPFINRVNADTSTDFKSYAPKTIFFHTSAGTLKAIAIELSLPPPQKGGAASNRVFTPADATDHLWDLAKFHASTIDVNYHQVISHFTFAHATMEPIIIASNRQLSELHPIRTLLKPYLRYTVSVNAAARPLQFNAGGVIETHFTMGKYVFQAAAKCYGAFWRFDTQGLPQNLIARGMAEPADSSFPGSVKLVLEDYPFAKDGLEIWDAINQWVAKYVEIIYQESDETVKADTELQAWWNEIVNVGHGDFKDATWWPKLDSTKNLVQIITTIAWISGPYHAALNFGQYAYTGFPLNKSTGTRRLVPEKGSAEYKELQQDPEKFFLSTITSPSQALKVMTLSEAVTIHSVDEEYIGSQNASNWTSDRRVKAAFDDFSKRIAAIEQNITQRNKDPALVNRQGPAQVPYTLLFPTSTSGITGRGVPNSVTV